MRITAKSRYAIAALIEIARQTQSAKLVSVLSVSESLGISKIFLEQAIAQLKKVEILSSVKGARGGYLLARDPNSITLLDILSAVENTLFDRNETTVGDSDVGIETALNEKIWNPLDRAVSDCLSGITLSELIDFADKQDVARSYMLNI
ncbi:MAG: Rrf2 family transcriptional regulator [Oscillospiraceae bacterium]|nr:Rrf2 family transcriptional regulator [Oscillospiraceae bacterium]